MNEKELLLQGARGRDAAPLELFVRRERPAESHFYAQGVTPADFGRLFSSELRPLDVLVYRMPPELLNPNYWEPLTKETEDAVREKMVGLITRSEGDRVLVWRSDRVARSRILRDGLDVPVEILNGYVFRTGGEGLLALASAWNGRNRFEWAALSGIPKGSADAISAVHGDLAQMRLSLPEEAFLFATQDDGLTRVLFAREDHLRRAVEALLRGFLYGVTDGYLGRIPSRVLDQIIALADGAGFSSSASEVEDKGRTVEASLHLGRSPWGVFRKPGEDPLTGDEQVFLYYDRTAGLWAAAS